MGGDFGDRMRELRARVGNGDLVGKVEVNQVYAKYQHEGLDLRHPRGGRAKYLGAPLLENLDQYLQKVADSVLEDGGDSGMIESMQALSNQVYLNAPLEFNNLKNSGHPSVTSDGHVIYDEPPAVERLTEEQLKALNRTRGRGRHA